MAKIILYRPVLAITFFKEAKLIYQFSIGYYDTFLIRNNIIGITSGQKMVIGNKTIIGNFKKWNRGINME